MWRSVPQIDAAWTRTSTSFGPGAGTGTSRSSAPGPGTVLRNARIGVCPGTGASDGSLTNAQRSGRTVDGPTVRSTAFRASGRTERRQDPVAARADLVGVRGRRL